MHSLTVQVIEAVYENLDLKREVFSKLDKVCKKSAILCTNTSTIDIDRVSLFPPQSLSFSLSLI